MLLYRRGYKNHSFHPAPKTSRTASQIVIKTVPKTIKSRSGDLLENTAKTNAENNTIWNQNRPGGGPTNVVFAPQCASGRAGGAAGLQDHPPEPLRPPQTMILIDFCASRSNKTRKKTNKRTQIQKGTVAGLRAALLDKKVKIKSSRT